MSKPTGQTNKAARTGTEAPEEQVSGREMMQEVLSRPSQVGARQNERIDGIVIGRFSSWNDEGQPEVEFKGAPAGRPVPALATTDLKEENIGRKVALSFVEGDPGQPLILGLIREEQPGKAEGRGEPAEVSLDGETMTLSAEKEIVLKCGKSSITLTRAGKIIVKGAYLSNHSTGVNRIKGGSVQIN